MNLVDLTPRGNFSFQLTDRAKATRALDFQKLIEFGLIERKGKGKATYYILKEK